MDLSRFRSISELGLNAVQNLPAFFRVCRIDIEKDCFTFHTFYFRDDLLYIGQCVFAIEMYAEDMKTALRKFNRGGASETAGCPQDYGPLVLPSTGRLIAFHDFSPLSSPLFYHHRITAEAQVRPAPN